MTEETLKELGQFIGMILDDTEDCKWWEAEFDEDFRKKMSKWLEELAFEKIIKYGKN